MMPWEIISFLGMGDIVMKESFDWASNDPDIIRATSIICRLRDDIVGHKVQTKFLSIGKQTHSKLLIKIVIINVSKNY